MYKVAYCKYPELSLYDLAWRLSRLPFVEVISMLVPIGAQSAPVIPSYNRADKMQLARLCTGTDPRGKRIPPAYRTILFKLVDERDAAYWSAERLAQACGVSIRTVGRAVAFWRQHRVLTVWWRKHKTPIKCVDLAVALRVLKSAVDLVIRICAAAARAVKPNRFNGGMVNRTSLASYPHLEKDKGPKPWHEGASPEFLALMASADTHQGHHQT